ncbi:transcriptional regulator [Kangiella sp. TOML190]|uniref:transcriptional regulator n=1 Tax=Kangiella sp. TOML190 TaxID=2931351 RepID=UPI00203D9669|nr:transcriptional regulator [Kangiella sp. TOML190]
MNTQNFIAVITADLVNSRKIELADSGQPLWHKALKAELANWGQSPTDWQIFRGDSFQLKLDTPAKALLCAISLKAAVRALGFNELDLRMAIGVGDQGFVAEPLTQSSGEAFVSSGLLFDKLKKRRLAIKTPWSELDEQLNLYLDLASLQMDRWNGHSAQTVAMALKMPNATQQQIAKALEVPQSRVSERLDRAGFETIMAMESYCRRLLDHGFVIKKRV